MKILFAIMLAVAVSAGTAYAARPANPGPPTTPPGQGGNACERTVKPPFCTPEPTVDVDPTPDKDDSFPEMLGDGPTGPTEEVQPLVEPAQLPETGAALPLGLIGGLSALYYLRRW